MKKALLGLSNRVKDNKDKIKVWSESFRKHSDGDVILLIANANEEDIKCCEELNIQYHKVVVDDLHHINHKRLEHTKNFLETSDIDLFLITDVFDVFFQSNPFDKLDINNFDYKKL